MLTHKWAERLGDGRIVGIDLDDPSCKAAWEHAPARRTSSTASSRPTNLPFADNEFEMATAIEVLEHVPEPATRSPRWRACAERYLLVSVPREPLWRGLNMARGAYWKDLGNTPGPRQPLVQARVRQGALAPVGKVVEARSPFPWTMLLVDVR